MMNGITGSRDERAVNLRTARALRVAAGYGVFSAIGAFAPLTIAASFLEDPAAQVVWFGGHALLIAAGAGYGFFRTMRRSG